MRRAFIAPRLHHAQLTSVTAEGGFCPLNSWSFPPGSSGQSTTKRFSIRNASTPSWYVSLLVIPCLTLTLLQKKLKKKEYPDAQKFAEDVELVFNNCMTFNVEHTPIWEDALTLKNTFRQLMSDLPPPHALPQYSQPVGKIKIKPSVMQASSSGSSLKLRIPTTQSAQKDTAPAPVVQPKPTPAPAPTLGLPVARNTARPVPPSAAAPIPVKSPPSPKLPVMKASAQPKAPPKPAPVPNQRKSTPAQPPPVPAQHYPATSYAKPPASIPQTRSSHVQVKAPEPGYTPPLAPIQNQHVPAAAPAPTPVPQPVKAATPLPVHQHQLKCAKVEIKPNGRTLWLDQRDGVKCWAVRLASGESRLALSDVAFLEQHDDEDDSDGDEHEEDDAGEDDMDVDTTPKKRGPGRPRKDQAKKRGRPPTRSSARVATLKSAKKKLDRPGEIQVKLNKAILSQATEAEGMWDIHVPAGSSVLEVGEVDGMTWKLYIDRMAALQ